MGFFPWKCGLLDGGVVLYLEDREGGRPKNLPHFHDGLSLDFPIWMAVFPGLLDIRMAQVLSSLRNPQPPPLKFLHAVPPFPWIRGDIPHTADRASACMWHSQGPSAAASFQAPYFS